MKYIRPSFKMGGTPSGIETLTPRKKFQFGTPQLSKSKINLYKETKYFKTPDQQNGIDDKVTLCNVLWAIIFLYKKLIKLWVYLACFDFFSVILSLCKVSFNSI